MSEILVSHEPTVRLAAFLVLFGTMATLELMVSARALRAPRGRRWPRNLGLTAINTAVLRVVFPAGATAAAVWASAHHFGLLQRFALPQPLAIVLAIVTLDAAIYAQHVALHAVPFLFRLHAVHHADIDFDVTLGARFHPVEMVLSMLWKLAAVAALGAPPADSAAPGETNSNFGFNLPWWDRLFGTYCAEPKAPLRIGLPAHQRAEEQSLLWMLALPFQAHAENGKARRQVSVTRETT